MNMASDMTADHAVTVVTEANKSGKQIAAEADVESFRKELGPFVVAAEATRMPMVFTDAKEPGHPIIFANDSFLALTGYRREEVLAQKFAFLAADIKPGELATIETVFVGQDGSSTEISCRHKDGGAFWAALCVSPVLSENGDVVQHFACLVDLTSHRREEDRLRFLLDELDRALFNSGWRRIWMAKLASISSLPAWCAILPCLSLREMG